MKPSRSTVETLTDHVLNFETSRRADKHRSAVQDVLAYVRGGKVLFARESYDVLTKGIVAHRELRRAARRLAKMVLRIEEERKKEHAESDALITRIIKLEAEINRTSKDEWDDRPIPEDAEIHAAFPTRSERHDLYVEAMRLVGAKRSKGELVKLVNWLLHRAQPATHAPDHEVARAFLWRILGHHPATNHVAELARLLARARGHYELLRTRFEAGELPESDEAMLGHRLVTCVRMRDGSLRPWSKRKEESWQEKRERTAKELEAEGDHEAALLTRMGR